MRKLYFFLISAFLLFQYSAHGQCTNSSAFGSAAAPTGAGTVTISSCSFQSEYSTITAVIGGNRYVVTASIPGTFITMRYNTPSGTAVAAGVSPLQFTAPCSGTYFAHWNTNSTCGTASSCMTTTIACSSCGAGASQCTMASAFGTVTAPTTLNVPTTISTCSFQSEYSTINGCVANRVYRMDANIAGTFVTIHQGTSSGPVIASGIAPLAFTTTVGGSYFAHWNTNSACGTASSCMITQVTYIGDPVCVGPPPNDNCGSPIAISCGGTVTGNTASATLDGPGTSCTGGSVAADMWYTVVGNGGNITATLCGSAYDTKVDVYTGSCGSLTSVVCNDDFCGLQSQVTWASTLGTTYLIRVHGFAGATGAFTMTVNCLPPNDNCTSAITINCGATLAGSNVGATADVAPVCTGATNPGVWYTFTGAGGIETLSTCAGASFDTKISVYTGTCAALTCVAGNDDFCGSLSQVSFPSTLGTTYFVLVHGFASATGTFNLTRTCPPPCAGVPSPGSITGPAAVICAGTPVNLSVSGFSNVTGLTFQWKSSSTPGGPYTNIPGATSTSYSFTATATTYYIVTVTCTNAGGGAANTVEFPVRVSNLVHSALLATPSVTCSPGTSVISGTVSGSAAVGNYTHTLTGPGTIGAAVVSGPNNSNVSFTVSNIPAGLQTYTLTSTDAAGCSKASPVTVTVNPTPVITLTTVPPVAPCIFSYTGPPVSIPDAVPAGVNIPLNVSGLTGPITDLNFRFDANPAGTCNATIGNPDAAMDHTFIGDLIFRLTSPAGTTVTLVNRRGGTRENICNTLLDDEGGFPSLSTVTSVSGQFLSGNFTPDNPLSAFDGQNGNGTWILNVSDNAGIDVGSMRRFSLVFDCNAICLGSVVRLDATAVPPTPQTFNGPNNTHIPAGGTTSGIGSPYPNNINVSGLITTGVTVKSVTLNNYSHTFPDDVDIVLVSPTGQSVILMSDAGGGPDATGQTFIFDDAAAATLADAAFNPSGTYKPTNFGAGDNWPAPGPLGAPASTTLSTFTGNPNGNWSLYAFDDVGGDIGIVSSWSITFNVPSQVVFSPLTNLFTDAAATIPYTGAPTYTVWAKPTVSTTYTATSTITGCTGTATALISVNTPPAITTQPVAPAAPVCPGFNTSFSVVATGSGLSYQWQRSTDNGATWNPVATDALHAGTTTPTITVINPTTAQNGHRYRVVVTGACPPAVTSSAVILVVATPPVITTQPAATVNSCVGLNPSFSVVATGVPAPNIYQWQVSNDGGATWNNLTTGGSFTPTFTITGVTLAENNTRYRVIVTNSCGQSVTSATSLLLVNTPTPVTITALPTRICLSDTLVPLSATPAGGSWSGIGVSGFNFVPSATSFGTYTLTYTYVNPAGCTSTGTVLARVEDCPERIRELDEDAVLLYPNPNNGRFNIKINSVLYNFLAMRVFTTDGQLLKTQIFNGLTYGRVVPVDISNLPSGAYMVKFYYDDGARTNEKTFPVIIQK